MGGFEPQPEHHGRELGDAEADQERKKLCLGHGPPQSLRAAMAASNPLRRLSMALASCMRPFSPSGW